MATFIHDVVALPAVIIRVPSWWWVLASIGIYTSYAPSLTQKTTISRTNTVCAPSTRWPSPEKTVT